MKVGIAVLMVKVVLRVQILKQKEEEKDCIIYRQYHLNRPTFLNHIARMHNHELECHANSLLFLESYSEINPVL